jgi:L-ascorbate metabolism protein UlaG (beta-lactamase superfamily)
VELRCDGFTLLLDPYVTRASLARCVLSPLVSDEARLRKHLPRADAIVLGHTHFDHAMDAPAIAKRTGARVLGGESAARLCRASGVPEAQIDQVDATETTAPAERVAGPFHITFHPSAHAPLLFGRVPREGEIAEGGGPPRQAKDFRCGAVFGLEVRVAGRTVFHLGSATVPPRLPAIEVDLALVCVAGWNATRSFPERVVRALSPRAIVLTHWDNFFRPVEEPVGTLPTMQLGRLVDRLTTADRAMKVGTLPLLGTLRL